MIGWLDCAAGASGDMLLGALVDAGVPLSALQAAVDSLGAGIALRAEPVSRHGLVATKVHVDAPDTATHRTWRDVRALLERAALADAVRGKALEVFALLARAEGAVHGSDPEDVHFHEVGALDAMADIVGVCAGFEHLGLTALTAGPVTLGGGTARGAHGAIPVPGPAVLALLAGVPVVGGPVQKEMCTPTGAALLAAHVDDYGPLPPMRVARTGAGAGTRELDELPNVLRLVLGEPVGEPPGALVLETNVDDLDPRLWPAVLAALLGAGASDAWLSPIVMKKGRPAHTLHALVTAGAAGAVRRAIFAHTSTIGLREYAVGKHALDRSTALVRVDGHDVRVKIASLDGRVINTSVEYADVAAAAEALGQPVKVLLARATVAAAEHLPR